MKKHQNTRINLLEAIRRIQSNNLIVWGAFIVGFDNDDKNIFNEQLEFIRASSIPVVMAGMLQALPGTPLYDRIKHEGRLRDDTAGGIRGAADSLVHTNITPVNMSSEELAEGYRYLAQNLYTYDNFSERLINAIAIGKKYGIKGRTQITKKGLMTLLRLLRYYLLSADLKRARMFMRVITRTLIHNPQHLYTALIHLVVYKHLKLFYEQGTSDKK
ncbi:MAG: DUF4070 domain-containing protein, partial [Nitrospirae bacterium]|nr:DUF4070 domain-containing protein [Nitrospirota bacterium]